MSTGVLLYGPPAAGKSTITQALTSSDDRFQLFQRLKVGRGRRTEYRMTTSTRLQQLREAGGIIWENVVYGATYAIDRQELSRMVASGVRPVIHLGQPEAVKVLLSHTSLTWLVVSLRCPRKVALARMSARGTGDDHARMRVWDQTVIPPFKDLDVDTSVSTPEEAAALIRSALEASVKSVVPG